MIHIVGDIWLMNIRANVVPLFGKNNSTKNESIIKNRTDSKGKKLNNNDFELAVHWQSA